MDSKPNILGKKSISINFGPRVYALVVDYANAADLSISQCVRRAIVEMIERESGVTQPGCRSCPTSAGVAAG